MRVALLTKTISIISMEYNAAFAMLVCHDNAGKLQENEPKFFLEKAINLGHESVLEHINLTYQINGITRACLQELARHRHISLSVESTRYTLKDKIKEFKEKYSKTQRGVELNIVKLSKILEKDPDISNDKLKYYINEFWPVNLVLTSNIRELRHIVKLRTSPAALEEFQDLSRCFVGVLPERFKYFFKDCISSEIK